jgi:hypothetical protein
MLYETYGSWRLRKQDGQSGLRSGLANGGGEAEGLEDGVGLTQVGLTGGWESRRLLLQLNNSAKPKLS